MLKNITTKYILHILKYLLLKLFRFLKLFRILNHTAKRILQSISIKTTSNIILHSKWGFDGTSGYSIHKQVTKGGSEDNTLFVTSMVPICLMNELTNEIIWQNLTCSSVRHCRPIRLQYLKETTEVSLYEEKYIGEQVSNLSSFES